MANTFTKEEKVIFDNMLEGFNDACVISKNVAKFGADGQTAERANDTIWRPVPYILSSQNRTVGSAVTADDVKQLAVPSTLGYKKNVSLNLTATEMRDQLQEGRLAKAAAHRLASDINTSVRDVASLEGSIVVTKSTAASSYDDIAAIESALNEQGVPEDMRYLALTTRDYNALAGDLAGRETLNKKALDAYERSRIGLIAGFETFKIDAGKSITGAAGSGDTIDTTGSQVDYDPQSSESTTAGEVNVDNRTQQITVSNTTSVAAGDCFTIADVESVHHITKEATGQLKTFRVISVDSGTTMTISPPIIGATGTPNDAQAQYQNCSVTATSATAAISYINTTTAGANPFWHYDSIEIMPGRYAVPSGQGVEVLRGTTDQGLELVMGKSFSNSTFTTLYTFDVFYGVTNLNPEMNGIALFGQA